MTSKGLFFIHSGKAVGSTTEMCPRTKVYIETGSQGMRSTTSLHSSEYAVEKEPKAMVFQGC